MERAPVVRDPAPVRRDRGEVAPVLEVVDPGAGRPDVGDEELPAVRGEAPEAPSRSAPSLFST
ncbi:MAG: hypothetical protein MZV64_10975 [Ignavibacteriales bacterium]|nr:hypothetical protein [Ignavibacteriales bacterium]